MQATSILDASALLAFLHGEPGAEAVAEALTQGALISAVNWAEVLTKLAELGESPEAVTERLEKMGILGFALEIHPFDELNARGVARFGSLPASRASPWEIGPAWPSQSGCGSKP